MLLQYTHKIIILFLGFKRRVCYHENIVLKDSILKTFKHESSLNGEQIINKEQQT